MEWRLPYLARTHARTHALTHEAKQSNGKNYKCKRWRTSRGGTWISINLVSACCLTYAASSLSIHECTCLLSSLPAPSLWSRVGCLVAWEAEEEKQQRQGRVGEKEEEKQKQDWTRRACSSRNLLERRTCARGCVRERVPRWIGGHDDSDVGDVDGKCSCVEIHQVSVGWQQSVGSSQWYACQGLCTCSFFYFAACLFTFESRSTAEFKLALFRVKMPIAREMDNSTNKGDCYGHRAPQGLVHTCRRHRRIRRFKAVKRTGLALH